MIALPLIFILTFDFYPVQCHVELTPLPDNVGILPFKLGNAFINPYNHVLLDYVDLENLYNNFTAITNFEEIKLAKYKNFESYFSSYLGEHSEYKLLVKNIRSKFGNIFSLNDRVKRGLFNFVGSTNKFLFGNLDAEDGEQIYKRIQSIEKNENEIVKMNNIQLSLSKQLTKAYNATISKLVENQNKLKFEVDKLISSERWNWSSFQLLFGQIISNLRFTDDVLNNIENAITFSKLGIIHPSIISIKKLEQMFRLLSKYHVDSNLLKINFSDLYTLVKVRSYLHQSKIVFALSVPIIYPHEFNYYKLIPIPTIENSILVPPNPYLVLNEEEHQYQQQPCTKLHEFYLCQKEEEIEKVDCIVQMLRNQKATKCHFAPIEFSNPIVEKISSDTILIFTPKKITIQQNCNGKDNEYARVMGNQLVKIPSDCKLIYNSLEIGNYESKLEGQPIYLPDITFNEKILRINKLKLGSVPLSKLHEISNQMEMLKPIDLEEMVNPGIKWSFIVLITLIIIVIMVIIFKDKLKQFVKIKRNNDIAISARTVDANLEEGGII